LFEARKIHAKPVHRPVLLLVIDCLRADRAFAQARIGPAFLSRLLERGRTYTNAFTPVPSTTPALASMLTGRYPFEHGVRGLLGFALPPDVPTVARALREAGYRTEADVTGPLVPQVGLFHEFDEQRYVLPRQATIHGPRGDDLSSRVRLLRAAGLPWFLLFHVWDLHVPRQVPAGDSGPSLSGTAYDRALGALDRRLDALLPDEQLDGVTICLVGDHGENLRLEPRGKLGKGIANLPWWRPTKNPAQRLVERYLDFGARRPSKWPLRVAPRALLTHAHHLFDPLVHVPLVLAGRGIAPGSSDALVAHVDLAPTFAELADVGFEGGAYGQPLPRDGGADPDRSVFLETPWTTPIAGRRQLGLRTHRWKYIELADGGSRALFDLERDPGERRNLARRLPTVAEELHERLRAALEAPRNVLTLTEDDAALVERRLRELGYL
jgi:arylsulfatase A-like enzyme